MINFDLIDKKKNLKKQRIAKFSSTIKKAILEIMNQEFILSNQIYDFSVVDAKMSPDLKYCDAFIVFFDSSSEQKNLEILEKLNKSGTHQGFKCGFLPLKLAISRKILVKMRLKYMPEIRFKKVSDDYLMLNHLDCL
jgi:ribosome-binding factor A